MKFILCKMPSPLKDETRADATSNSNDHLLQVPSGSRNGSFTPKVSKSFMTRQICSKQELMERMFKSLNSMKRCVNPTAYKTFNLKLGERYLEQGDDISAIYHFSETHGITLRKKAENTFTKLNQSEGSSLRMPLVAFNGSWSCGPSGLLKRLRDLPSEWTVIQLTMQFDQMSCFSPSVRNIGFFLTRLSCGELCCDKMLPITTLVEPIGDIEATTLMQTMSNVAANMTKKAERVDRRRVNLVVETQRVVNDLDSWLEKWGFLMQGWLQNQELNDLIINEVDKLISSCPIGPKLSAKRNGSNDDHDFREEISDRVYQLLILLALYSDTTSGQVYSVVSSLIPNPSLAKHIANGIVKIQNSWNTNAWENLRHPVILIIDEKLEVLPWEMTKVLKHNLVCRMPSVHFIHAHYKLQEKFYMQRTGLDTKKGYYLIDPDKNLPDTYSVMGSFARKTLSEWNGLIGVRPTSEQFKEGLSKHDAFLYCGHGGGNQYFNDCELSKISSRGIALLFGCASIKVYPLGGRVEGGSLFNAYLMAGSICVVGLLWSVFDKPTNVLTTSILSSWLDCSDPIEVLEKRIDRMNLNEGSDAYELLRSIRRCRLKPDDFYVAASLVVRGLPPI